MEFFIPLDNFTLIGDVTVAGEGLQISTYAQHVEQLRFFSVLHLLRPFIMVISEDLWHSDLTPSVWQSSCLTCLNDLGMWRPGFEHPNFRLRGERSNPLRYYRADVTEEIMHELITCKMLWLAYWSRWVTPPPPHKTSNTSGDPKRALLYTGQGKFSNTQHAWNKCIK